MCHLGKVYQIFVFLSVALDVNGRFRFKFNLYGRGFGVEHCSFLKYIFPHLKLSELVLIVSLHDVSLVDLHIAAGLLGHGDPPLTRNARVSVLGEVNPMLRHLFGHLPAIKCANVRLENVAIFIRSHIISHVLLEECPCHESEECS